MIESIHSTWSYSIQVSICESRCQPCASLPGGCGPGCSAVYIMQIPQRHLDIAVEFVKSDAECKRLRFKGSCIGANNSTLNFYGSIQPLSSSSSGRETAFKTYIAAKGMQVCATAWSLHVCSKPGCFTRLVRLTHRLSWSQNALWGLAYEILRAPGVENEGKIRQYLFDNIRAAFFPGYDQTQVRLARLKSAPASCSCNSCSLLMPQGAPHACRQCNACWMMARRRQRQQQHQQRRR